MFGPHARSEARCFLSDKPFKKVLGHFGWGFIFSGTDHFKINENFFVDPKR